MTSEETRVALLMREVEIMQDAIVALETLTATMQDQDDRRVRAGIAILGAGGLSLLGTVGALLVYIWNKVI